MGPFVAFLFHMGVTLGMRAKGQPMFRAVFWPYALGGAVAAWICAQTPEKSPETGHV